MKDKYNVSITALAILTGSNKQFSPETYVEEYLGTRLTYKYNIYKILDQDEVALRLNPNPFAVVILVALSAIRQKNVNDLTLKRIKHELYAELSKRNVEGAKRTGIMNFVKYYVNFESPEMMITFENEIEQLLGRTTLMGTEEYLLDKAKKEGLKQGIETGIKQGLVRGRYEEALEIAGNFKKLGIDIADISKGTGISIEEIQAL